MTHIERLQQRGIRRIENRRQGFRYQTADGGKVSASDLTRIAALAIPPAWTNVAINPAPTGRLQAIGKDAAGRWQYLYHADHVRAQERKKFARLIHFGASLPSMRKTVASHLRLSGLPRERVLASVLKILAISFLRPGSEIYANEHGSYGITTLRSKHVSIKGDLVVFDFKGKSGVHQHRELKNKELARVMKELLGLPGRRVFKYAGDDGQLATVTPRHINAYIKEVMGDRFSAKDFRTWAGTLICASALARVSSNGNNGLTTKQKIGLALTETAEALGNTPAVCRSAYVSPEIFMYFEKGLVVSKHLRAVEDLMSYRGKSLHAAERALLRFLKNN
jgi:DNA topoisomerase I